nr:uncharacterized protein LOC127328813 [Lolium perenne]
MCGTEVVLVFLQHRVQPLMSRPHQLWLYTDKCDKSRISSADLSADELRDEASSVVQCYLPTPESGVEPEDDDDDSEGTEDVQQVFEDSNVQEDDTVEEAAFTRSKRRLQIDEDFITTGESSPSDKDNDAVGASPPSPADKGPSGFFATEDDLELSDDDHVPLAKRAKLSAERTASAKEPNPSPAESTPPTRTAVEKIPVSKVIPPGDAPTSPAARDHRCHPFPQSTYHRRPLSNATTHRRPHKVVAREADGSVKFGQGEGSAYLFDPDIYTDGRISVHGIDVVLLPEDDTKPSTPITAAPVRKALAVTGTSRSKFWREAENAQLRKTVKSSADQVLEANRLSSDAKKENALLKEELSKLKQQMKDEQEARRATVVAVDKKEGVLRKSIKDLLEAANITITRRHQLREDSTSDALSLAAESNVQVLGLLQKTRGALSRLYSMIFPKMKQDKTLGEMADAFLIDSSEPVEIASSSSRAELFSNPSTNNESDLVHHLRDQVSRLNKDITSLRAMAALVKKKGEIATAIEKYALDGLHVATESLGFVTSDKSEENRKIHEKVEAMTDKRNWTIHWKTGIESSWSTLAGSLLAGAAPPRHFRGSLSSTRMLATTQDAPHQHLVPAKPRPTSPPLPLVAQAALPAAAYLLP